MSKQFAIAMQLATEYHADQMYGDKPYMYHLLGVLKLVEAASGNMPEQCVALMHDILEDTECTAHKMRVAGVTEEIIAAVQAITYRPFEEQRVYLRRVWENPIARFVKKRDSLFNLIHSVQAGNSKRIKKYTKVLQFLEEYKSTKERHVAEKKN